MASRFLTANFDNTQTLIDTNPQNEDNLINDYINLIIENKNNARFVRGATYRDNDNMPNIKIMNNFQRYGPDGYEQPIFIPTTTTHNIITCNLSPPHLSSSSNLTSSPSSNLTLTSSPSSNLTLTPSPSSNLTLTSSPSSNLGLGTTSGIQQFRNRETFQNYYDNFINGGFKEYYRI